MYGTTRIESMTKPSYGARRRELSNAKRETFKDTKAGRQRDAERKAVRAFKRGAL